MASLIHQPSRYGCLAVYTYKTEHGRTTHKHAVLPFPMDTSPLVVHLICIACSRHATGDLKS